LNDLNNFCGADRKLIINDTYEFWVHDAALILNSNYFKEILFGNKKSQIREETVSLNSLPNLLSNKKKSLKKIKEEDINYQSNKTRNLINLLEADSKPNSDKKVNMLSSDINQINNNKNIQEINTSDINIGISSYFQCNSFNKINIKNQKASNENEIINKIKYSNNRLCEKENKEESKIFTKTFIYVPHPDFFFDILTFIYSRDADRLALAADEPESFLSILNLSIFLDMNDVFFQVLMEKCEIKINKELLNHHLWSRFSFTFDVLKSLLKLIPEENNYLKVTACLSWLKEDNTLKQSRGEAKIQERELELLTSKEFYELKNFLAEKIFLQNLSIQNLNKIRKSFPRLIPAFDARVVIEKYIEKSGIKVSCKICKKVFYFY